MPTVHSNDIRYYTQEYRDELNATLETLKQETDVDLVSSINSISVPNNNVAIDECKQECLNAANQAKTHLESIENPIDSIISLVTSFYDGVQATGDEINTLTANANEVMEAFISSLNDISDVLDSACRSSSTLIEKDVIDECFSPMEIADSNNSEFLNDYFTDDDGHIDRDAVESVFDKLESDPESNAAYADAYATFCVDYISDENTTDEQIEELLNLNLDLGMVQTNDRVITPEPTYIDGEYYVEVIYVYEASPSLLMINDRMYAINARRYNEQYSDWSQYEGNSSGLQRVAAYLDTMGVLTFGEIGAPHLFTEEELAGLDPDISIPYQSPRPFPNVDYSTDDSGIVHVSFGIEADNPAQQARIFRADGTEQAFVSFQVDPLRHDLANEFSDYDLALLADYIPELISYENGSLAVGTTLNLIDILKHFPKIGELIMKSGEFFPVVGYFFNALDIFVTVDSYINGNSIYADYVDGKHYFNYLNFLDRYYDNHAGIITFTTYDGEEEKYVSTYSYVTDRQVAFASVYWEFLFDYYGIDSDNFASMTDDDIIALLQAGGDADENSFEQFETKMRSAFDEYCSRTGLSGVSFDSLSYEEYSVLAGCIGHEEQMDELVNDYEENGVYCFD